MPELVTQAEYARRQGVRPQTIGEWKKLGRIVMAGRRVDVAASDKRLEETECPGHKAGADERAGKQPKEAKDFYVSRAELQAIKVKQAQIELDQTTRLLILREDAERQAFEDGRRFRDAMMGLPDQYADRLATITDVREMREALRLMLRDAIGGVSDE
jgi:hypothetical protein